MEGIADQEAYGLARRCLQARARYRNDDTRRSLERAAGKYALRALGLDGEMANHLPSPAAGPTPAWSGWGVLRAGLKWMMGRSHIRLLGLRLRR